MLPLCDYFEKAVASPLNAKDPALFPPGAFYGYVTNHSDILALQCSWVEEQKGLKVAKSMKY